MSKKKPPPPKASLPRPKVEKPSLPSPKQLDKLERQLTKCGFHDETQSLQGLRSRVAQAGTESSKRAIGKSRMDTSRTVEGGSPADASTAVIWGLHAYGNSAGINVTEQVAQNISTLYACIALRAQCLATMPLSCYRRTKAVSASNPEWNGVYDKDIAYDHPVHWMWTHEPDDFITSFGAREAASGHVDLRGNAYFELGRNFRGQAMKAYLLDPRRMHIEYPLGYNASDTAQFAENYKIYRYDEMGHEPIKLDRREVMHVQNFSYDGLEGVPPLTMFRETLGLTVAANRYTAEYFRKGGSPMGFLTKPNVLSKPQRDSLRDEWNELHSGVENSHQIGILSGGLDWKPIGFNNNDSQLLGLRAFQRILVAELFRTPLYLIGIEEPLTSIEAVQLQFIMFTMLPIMKRWEAEMNRVLFTPKEKFTYFVEHDPEIFLRADAKTMAEVDQIRVRNSLSLINEIRRRDGKKGIEYGDVAIAMASQYASLKDVVEGKALPGKNQSGSGKKSDQPDSEENRMVNRIAKAYARLDGNDRKKVMGMMVSMNCVGNLATI